MPRSMNLGELTSTSTELLGGDLFEYKLSAPIYYDLKGSRTDSLTSLYEKIKSLNISTNDSDIEGDSKVSESNSVPTQSHLDSSQLGSIKYKKKQYSRGNSDASVSTVTSNTSSNMSSYPGKNSHYLNWDSRRDTES